MTACPYVWRKDQGVALHALVMSSRLVGSAAIYTRLVAVMYYSVTCTP